jgi:hypothetical protein
MKFIHLTLYLFKAIIPFFNHLNKKRILDFLLMRVIYLILESYFDFWPDFKTFSILLIKVDFLRS